MDHESAPDTAPEKALETEKPSTVAIPEFTLCLDTKDQTTLLRAGDKLHIRPVIKEVRFTRFTTVSDQAIFVVSSDGGVRQSLILDGAPLTDEAVDCIASEIARRFGLDAIRFRREGVKKKDKNTVAFLLIPRLAKNDE